MPRTTEELVKHLRELSQMQVGQPYPAWFHGKGYKHWGEPIAELAGEAADRIEELRRECKTIRATKV